MGWCDVTHEELMADEDALEAQGDAMTEDEAALHPRNRGSALCGHPGAPSGASAPVTRPLPWPSLPPSFDARTLEQSM